MKKMSDDPALWEKQPAPLPPESKKKVFIICPIRNVSQEVIKFLTEYVKDLEENKGCIVYWPYRDNPYQESDPIGLRIITHNRGFMIDADEVHIFYDKSSTGSIFDFGMLFMALEIFNDKEIRLINNQDIQPTPKKSFENILLALRKEFGVTEDMLGDLY